MMDTMATSNKLLFFLITKIAKKSGKSLARKEPSINSSPKNEDTLSALNSSPIKLIPLKY